MSDARKAALIFTACLGAVLTIALYSIAIAGYGYLVVQSTTPKIPKPSPAGTIKAYHQPRPPRAKAQRAETDAYDAIHARDCCSCCCNRK